VMELCLAHLSENACDNTDCLDQRREIMQNWADFCTPLQAEVINIKDRVAA